jgi:myo-inositol-hexaphosphate 3-phosphohydrolase
MKIKNIQSALALVICLTTSTSAIGQNLTQFGNVSLEPAFEVSGAGTVIDSIAIWEAPDPNDTLMFVTAKGNDLVEVWKFPFENNELPSIRFDANVNGAVVDQDNDLLYVSDRVVSVFSLPDLKPQGEFGEGTIGVGENNLDILKVDGDSSVIYVSDDHTIHRFDAASLSYLGAFAPSVSSIESVLADDFYQMILVPDEQGPSGNPGIYTYHPDGAPFERSGSNRFGNDGEFQADEEGIALYSFPAHGTADNGTGFVVVSDQRSTETDFEFFDRQTGAHLGTVNLTGVSSTDGIASTQRPLPQFPMGVFAAINNDTTTAVVGWDAIFTAIGWDIAPEAMSITTDASGTTTTDQIDFTVIFSEHVAKFDDAADVVITHQGTSHGGVTIVGSELNYTVTVSGIGGFGAFTLSINPSSDLEDSASQKIAASVVSQPVFIGTPYHLWAVDHGLAVGVNDGPTNDPDADGCPNFKEFAIDGDPFSGTGAIKTRVELVDIGDTYHLNFTFPCRNGVNFSGSPSPSGTADGVQYSVSASDDLKTFDQPLAEVIPALKQGLPELNEGWSYHTFKSTFPAGEFSSAFVRLSIDSVAP